LSLLFFRLGSWLAFAATNAIGHLPLVSRQSSTAPVPFSAAGKHAGAVVDEPWAVFHQPASLPLSSLHFSLACFGFGFHLDA
jgi:hypothetical protein